MEVIKNAHVHGQYRQQHASQRYRCEFVDKLDAYVYDRTHNHQKYCSIHAEIVVHNAAVFGEVTKNR